MVSLSNKDGDVSGVNGVFETFMNIYLHDRLKQTDPETEVSTLIHRKLVWNQHTNETYFR